MEHGNDEEEDPEGSRDEDRVQDELQGEARRQEAGEKDRQEVDGWSEWCGP